MEEIKKITEMMKVIEEIEKTQESIKERLEKGEENLTEQDIMNSKIDAERTKRTREECKKY